ncbi:MAG TPA: lipocalin-like domain-containing protein [Steroidobacteraceae bacterium]|nr:lipocalin-like domain-containing protein [Steroidobacteraceae bacterium]
MSARRCASRLAALALALAATLGAAGYPEVTPGARVSLPADAGSHPEFHTEWWYVTGWLATAGGEPLGFQVTFFRTRPTLETENPSAFAPRAVLIAHAAVSDPRRGRLWHDQRIRRAGFGLAEAAAGRTDVHLGDWSLRAAGAAFVTAVRAEDFGFELRLEPTGPALLNGDGGYSQKGPAPGSASLYYSIPQLTVAGTLARAGKPERVSGRAWLDHEWSSAYLDAQAVGWDWIGLNLDDGGALMAFRIRDAQGRARWAGGTLRTADGRVRVLAPAEIGFTPGRRWRSPRTLIDYPVEWQVRAGDGALALAPLMDDQESDSRPTTGAVYWEGAVEARRDGQLVGRGYLELTGYGERLRLR